MRDAEPDSYVFEEITPERMRRVNLLMEKGYGPDGIELPNNKNHVYRYRCPECAGVTTVRTRNVGLVRYVVDCAGPGCHGDAVQEDAPAVHVAEHVPSEGGGKIDATFFRPVEPDEVDAWAARVDAEAARVVEAFGGDPGDTEHPTGLAFRDAEATRLINGHLAIEYGRVG